MAKYWLWSLLLLVSALLHFSYVDCCFEEEQLALLEIKAYMKLYEDPTYSHIPWFNSANIERRSSSDCCQWFEVGCNVSTGRVTSLVFSSKVMRDADLKNPWLFNVTLFRHFRDLVSLDLSGNQINGLVEDNGSTKISTLKNLKILKLDGNSFMTSYISLSVFTSLRTLKLSGSLRDSSFKLQELANLRELQILDLSSNYLNTTIQGLCELRNLQQLKLNDNLMYESLPSCIGNLSSLEFLDLSYNQFKGKLPSTLSNLTSLNYLDLSNNNFEGKWSLDSMANHSKLQVLLLSGNMIEVQTEDSTWLATFQLQSLDLKGCNLNKLDGTIPNFLLHQYNLSEIDLSNNNLVGSFPNWLLSNNTQLGSLYLANNSLVGRLQFLQHANLSLEHLDISRNNFQGQVPGNIGYILPELVYLDMSGNHLKGHIPTSLGDLKELTYLDLSDNNFSGEMIPSRLFSHCGYLDTLHLSNNNLHGEMIPEDMNLPNLNSLKLSNNHLGGTIKNVLHKSTNLYYLDISYNKVTGALPRWIGNLSRLEVLSMSSNYLQGHIPRELWQLRILEYLDLSHNNFSGHIPPCSDFHLLILRHMHLQGNSLTGEIPSVLSSCLDMISLDLRNNQLSGGIPYWINKLSRLYILLLAGNDLRGQIPHRLCQLNKINILDLSRNNLSGKIPTCFGNMSFGINFVYGNYTSEQTVGYLDNENGDVWESYSTPDEVEFLVKNRYLNYTGGVLVFMSGLDLSCNQLTGVIPSQLGHLREIHSLNLSHNHLIGSIPSSFSSLNQIESLDLSCNSLTGTIPPQLVDLNFLEVFNVSYNNLTGRVPEAAQFANFDESSYFGNPGLHGFSNSQLHNKTALAPTSSGGGDQDGNSEEAYKVDFLWSFGMSCAIMFLTTVAILCINPQWRQAWFDFVDWHLLWWMSVPLLSL